MVSSVNKFVFMVFGCYYCLSGSVDNGCFGLSVWVIFDIIYIVFEVCGIGEILDDVMLIKKFRQCILSDKLEWDGLIIEILYYVEFVGYVVFKLGFVCVDDIFGDYGFIYEIIYYFDG